MIPQPSHHRSHRRPVIAATASLAMTLTGIGIAQAPGSQAAGRCPSVTWGSLTKSAASGTTHALTSVRSGRHACYDRLVLDLGRSGSGVAGYTVSYVGAVRAEGSGAVVPVRGGARLQVTANAPADRDGKATYSPPSPRELVNTAGYSTFRQVAWAGSFEGRTTVALGVRARLPMRAFVLKNPDGGQRLVVDVRHRW